MKVFLSYAREDAAFVQRLSADLEARAIDVWLDTDDLPTTDEDRWRRSIVQGIRESAALVVVLSPDSVSSGPVEREVTIAAEIARRIIPVVHRPCELPDGFVFELAGVQRVDFVDQPYEQALEQLMRRIGTAAEVVAPPLPDTPTAEQDPLVVAPISDEPIDSAPTATVAIPPAVKPETEEPSPAATVAVALDDGSERPSGAFTLVHVALGVGMLVAAVVVGLVLVAGNNVPEGASSPPPSVASSTNPTLETSVLATTSAPAETVAESTAVETRAPSTTSPATTSTIAQTSTSTATTTSAPTTTTPPTDPPVVTGDVTALALVDQLLQAYVDRDWDTVRYMNSNHATKSDEELFEGYGTADGFPRLESQSRYVLGVKPTGPNQWEVTGTLFAWDYKSTGEQETNIGCMIWYVDNDARTATQSDYFGSDGKRNRRLDGWVPMEEFEARANEYCRV